MVLALHSAEVFYINAIEQAPCSYGLDWRWHESSKCRVQKHNYDRMRYAQIWESKSLRFCERKDHGFQVER